MDIGQSLTLLVAVGVALVGYSQWRTANQRVVLDLFERRLKVFNKIEDVLVLVTRNGAADDENYFTFVKAKAEARFLFGKEVDDYLQKILEDVVDLQTYTVDVVRASSSNQEELFDKRTKAKLQIGNFFTAGHVVFGPYMRLDQKNTPFWRLW